MQTNTVQERKRATLEAQGWDHIDDLKDGCFVMRKKLFTGEYAFLYIRRNGSTWSHQK